MKVYKITNCWKNDIHDRHRLLAAAASCSIIPAQPYRRFWLAQFIKIDITQIFDQTIGNAGFRVFQSCRHIVSQPQD